MTHEMGDDHCPSCQSLVTSATKLYGSTVAAPKPGDVSVCIRCLAIVEFDQRLRLRMCDTNSLSAALRMQLTVIQRKIRAARARMN